MNQLGACDAMSDFSDEALLRYSRHIFLPEVDVDGQKKILAGRVAIIGAGGLGCPVAMYLVASGVGFLRIIDADTIEQSNLSRQIAFTENQIGFHKAHSLKERACQLNSQCTIESMCVMLDEKNAHDLIFDVDIVVDCTDNFKTRYLLNQQCFLHKKVLISGAAIGFSGQLSVYDFRRVDSPCYQCLYSEQDQSLQLSCSESGVLSPVVGIVGSLQASEVLKVLIDRHDILFKKLLLVDVLSMQHRLIHFSKDPACPVCSQVI